MFTKSRTNYEIVNFYFFKSADAFVAISSAILEREADPPKSYVTYLFSFMTDSVALKMASDMKDFLQILYQPRP